MGLYLVIFVLNMLVFVIQMVSDEDMQQNTPLHLAVENSSHDVAKMCIEKGL